VTEIDFYTHVDDRLKVTCQLVLKARSQDLKILIFGEGALLKAIDERLWTFQPQSFIPHCPINDPTALHAPVLLAESLDQTLPFDDVIINLSPEPPTQFSRFKRLIEIVGQDDTDKRLARERFRFYRDRGYVLRTHDLSQTAR
jgi:DNA polymerase-3 subunit chi